MFMKHKSCTCKQNILRLTLGIRRKSNNYYLFDFSLERRKISHFSPTHQMLPQQLSVTSFYSNLDWKTTDLWIK